MKTHHKQQMQKLYEKRAAHYDFLHHLQTLWKDDAYRKLVAEYAFLQQGNRVLDIGTGTGLTGLKAFDWELAIHVVGVDLTLNMLRKAAENIENSPYAGSLFSLVQGDTEEIPFQDNTFDAVMSTYGFGGVEDKEKGFQEIQRVAKNGARISMLEMCAPPAGKRFKSLIHEHLVVPWISHPKVWLFDNTDLEDLFQKYGVEIKGSRYYGDYVFGSSGHVYGVVRK